MMADWQRLPSLIHIITFINSEEYNRRNAMLIRFLCRRVFLRRLDYDHGAQGQSIHPVFVPKDVRVIIVLNSR